MGIGHTGQALIIIQSITNISADMLKYKYYNIKEESILEYHNWLYYKKFDGSGSDDWSLPWMKSHNSKRRNIWTRKYYSSDFGCITNNKE